MAVMGFTLVLYNAGLTSILSVDGLLAFAASLFSFLSNWLRSDLHSERIRDDEYADGSPSRAHYQLNRFRKLCFQYLIKEHVED